MLQCLYFKVCMRILWFFLLYMRKNNVKDLFCWLCLLPKHLFPLNCFENVYLILYILKHTNCTQQWCVCTSKGLSKPEKHVSRTGLEIVPIMAIVESLRYYRLNYEFT